jgi:hypothetical protein
MTMMRGAIAILLLLGASRARADCPHTAVPSGDPELVDALAARLASAGIATANADGCPALHVELARREQQIHLRVIDAYERTGERDVRDVATAAAIIESWVVQEVDPGGRPDEPLRPAPPPVFHSGVAALAFGVIDKEETLWYGASLAACVRVGWACVGASIGYEVGSTPTDDLGMATSYRELTTHATFEVPFALGGFVVRPAVGAGYLRVWSQLTSHGVDQLDAVVDHIGVAAHVAVLRTVMPWVAVYAELGGGTTLTLSGDTNFQAALSVGLRVQP